ncbi:MAG: 50S ribosomal protein L17 [Atopobiaceae bacterium]|nr:50S ribosomal protein L17 [Atopobiaceae bacterium]MBQ3282741.1 50S ribosomal protein L17 [Atopobiaceae bacterium]MBQ6411048.1 50S ribosomal protein L17 [Atopobiaceae bacterium]MBR3385690.1 50S ribosomal protein L17 [Atopobiaceae bacterium]
MRHNKKSGMKLGTDASHTKAIKKGLVASLLANDRIKTTVQRAKAIRPDVDKVVTWAKKGDLHSRRLAIAKVGDAEIVREVFEKAAQGMWAGRDGGYTRIMKLGTRKGDNAEVVIIEMVNEAVKKKAAAPKTEVKKVEKVAEPEPEVEEAVEAEAEEPAAEEPVEAEAEAEE